MVKWGGGGACCCHSSNLWLVEMQPPSLPDVVEEVSSSDSWERTSITIFSSSSPPLPRQRNVNSEYTLNIHSHMHVPVVGAWRLGDRFC